LADQVMIIGVDRLDYSKGIALRMEAFDRFISTHSDWRGKLTYLQITPRSRSEIQEYADIERQIDETAGRINRTHGEASLAARVCEAKIRKFDVVALDQLQDILAVNMNEFPIGGTPFH
jgi:trehalose-6-phosphate synthase